MIVESKLPLVEAALTSYAASKGVELTPVDFAEAMNILLGLNMEKAAEVAGVSEETIRTRRKKIYKRLKIEGSNELVLALFWFQLKEDK